MNPHISKTWLIVVFMIVVNIGIFYFLSKKIEDFVLTDTAKTMIEEGSL
jgi:hypothetical protein